MGFARRLSPDEIGHTQRGNNNAYCQDNEISWIKWDESNAEKELIALKVITLRRNHPVFRRRNFFQGRAIKGAGVKDILWLRPDGREMTDEEWNQEHARTLGVFFSGSAVDEMDERGQPVTDENFLCLMNAHHEEVPFLLPTAASGMRWVALIDTSCQSSRSPGLQYEAGTPYSLQARSLALLVERERDQVRQDRRHET
jgi:isoamylase